MGYVEGQNVAIEFRWGNSQYDHLPELAADLVRRRVAVLVAGDGPSSPVAKAATAAIPVIFNTASNPVATGLVASLNRPGANVTGVTILGLEIGPKLLQIVHELVPKAASVALIVNQNNRNAETLSQDIQSAARSFGLKVHVLHASTESEIEKAFTALSELHASALVIGSDTFFTTQSAQLATLMVRNAVPAIYQYREFPAAGGLMSYGASLTDSYRLVGVYAGRILKGDKPADLPVQQSSKVELIINLKAAKTLGLTIPLTLLGRADEVIE